MSSTDPFANTTTVKNILQHVLSPKIVSDGGGGFKTATDLVNIDTANATTVNAAAVNATTVNAYTGAFTYLSGNFGTTQAGIGSSGTDIPVTGFTSNSVLFVQPWGTGKISSVAKNAGSFNVSLSPGTKYDWFIAQL